MTDPPSTKLPSKGEYIGWAAYIPIGVFFAYRGFIREKPLPFVFGSVAIAIGVIMLIMILLPGLRPWRRVVFFILMGLICLAMTVYKIE